MNAFIEYLDYDGFHWLDFSDCCQVVEIFLLNIEAHHVRLALAIPLTTTLPFQPRVVPFPLTASVSLTGEELQAEPGLQVEHLIVANDKR